MPTTKDALHLNILLARNWFQIPNSLDQLTQDQRQKVVTFDFAPGYQHTFNATSLLTINPFVRQDRVHYYPSPNMADDSPATVSQSRRLTNWGVRGDFSYTAGHHNVKIGGQLMQTHLQENFSLGITDPGFNAGPDFNPGLSGLDLTRGGSLFRCRRRKCEPICRLYSGFNHARTPHAESRTSHRSI